jgi:shikimate dehydrogenase
MERTEKKQHRFGLVGKNISYSFSKGYFTQLFEKQGLKDHSYENFDIQDIADFPSILKDNKDITGLNVTIPYKEVILPYLDSVDEQAANIGAVNTIKVTEEGLIGYNTDSYGFEQSLVKHLKKQHKKALILGTGGASKAIAYTLTSLAIPYMFVSRNPEENQLSYADVDESILASHKLIVNCTPLGTYPNILEKPGIPYKHLTSDHLLFDLIYNPEKSAFLKAGENRGASICNGLAMLELQADKAWTIWHQ